jgi:hypothetical protein
VVALLGGVATLGGVLLLRDDDRPAGASATTRDDRDRGASGDELVDAPADGSELTGQTTASAPATARPSTDRLGNRVTFGAGNVLDGDPHTCWRMAGDGSGRALTFRFDAPVVVTAVGLVNGYAKVDGRDDWYAANRRVLAVEWLFDDGTTVTQDLDEVRDLQTIAVDPVAGAATSPPSVTSRSPAPPPESTRHKLHRPARRPVRNFVTARRFLSPSF